MLSRTTDPEPRRCALPAWALACALVVASAPPVALPAQPPYVQKPQPRVSTVRLEKKIHDLINRERKARRLAPLSWDGPLAAIARGHSGDMAKRDYFSHDSPEGRQFHDRYSKAAYRCALRVGDIIYGGAENLARGTLYASITTVNGVQYFDWKSEDKIAADAVEGWMASRGHRTNILTPHWKHEGIGVVVAPDRKVYVTENFC